MSSCQIRFFGKLILINRKSFSYRISEPFLWIFLFQIRRGHGKVTVIFPVSFDVADEYCGSLNNTPTRSPHSTFEVNVTKCCNASLGLYLNYN